MSRRISTKAAESGQTTGGPADDAIAPPVSSATAAEEHHTVVEPEIIEPEILPKQASGKTAAHKAAKPMDVTDAEDEDSEDIGDDLPEDDVAALDPDADILPEGDTLPAPSQQHLPSLSSSKDSLHLYLREVSRFPMLKPDEEFDLARRVQKTGDSDAAFRLVSSHLRLVVKIAMDFQRRWMQNVLDLIQEGNVGLMRAVNKFDPDKGIKYRHAWNVVRLGDAYYHLDATLTTRWDRRSWCATTTSIWTTGGCSGITRPWSIRWPACADGGRFYYREAKLSFTRPEEVAGRAAQAVRKGKPLVFHWRGGPLTGEVLGSWPPCWRRRRPGRGGTPRSRSRAAASSA